MPGDPASQALAMNDLKDKREKLDKYEDSLGLNECKALDLSGEDISGLSQEERDEVAIDLASYGIHVQRTISKERAILHWLENKINLTISPELQDYTGYYSTEQRRAVAINGNAYAKELEELRMNSQLKVDLLDGLTYQINQKLRTIQTRKGEAHGKTNFN